MTVSEGIDMPRIFATLRQTRSFTLLATGGIALLLTTVVSGQGAPADKARAAAKAYTPPRTPWGDPDLQGAFTNKDENGIPLERPKQFEGRAVQDVSGAELQQLVKQRNESAVERAGGIGGAETGAGPVHWYEYYGAKNSRPWLVVDPADGRIPPTTSAAQARAAAITAAFKAHGDADSAEIRSLYDRCITRGVPGSMMPAIYGNSYQIVQAPGYVAIRYEMIHETRIIPLDRRPHVGDAIRTYMGDARGRWDGNTLVVETTNFNGKNAADVAGYGSPDRGATPNLRVVERFKPVGPNSIEWSVTLDDTTTWARPWTFAMNLTKDEGQPVFEYACHEGNYGLTGILSAARAEEK
jgi:hypothetical protein